MIRKLIVMLTLLLGGLGLVWFVNFKLNEQIIVIEEVVEMDELPEVFDKFKILQVTDLHGIMFGKNQEQLVKLFHDLDYDLLAITGDMTDLHVEEHPGAMMTLLEQFEKEVPIAYVAGNHGPFVYDEISGEINEFGRYLQSYGVHLLDTPLLIEKEGQRLWVSEQSVPFKPILDADLFQEEDVLIGLMHYPMNETFYAKQRQSATFPEYDLILAGHYHGGQWRIPFYGALFIPDVNGNGWLPAQECVSGLMNYSGYWQYVSRGLGASGKNVILRKRWFNPPEVNVLTLRSR